MRFNIRRTHAVRPADVFFCDECGQACTAECRPAARLNRTRTQVLTVVPLR